MINLKIPGGRRPWCCCHFNAWPNSANSLDDGTTDTSPANDWAIAILRFSLDVPSGYASRGSKYDRAKRFSRIKKKIKKC